MITTDVGNTEARDLEAMYTRKQLDLVWTTTPIQPLQSSYSPSQMLQIILQKSRHMIPIGDIQISFRPVIQYTTQTNGFATLAQKMMTCVTPACASDLICFQSATVEGNQLCSQTNFSLTRTRNLVQNYVNQLENVKKRDKMKSSDYGSGILFPSANGCANTGFQEVSVTHPDGQVTGGSNYTASRFENDYMPRAIIERNVMYNPDFCSSVSGEAQKPMSEYFSPEVTVNGDATNGNITPGIYPLLPLQITPSINIYKEQQSRFSVFRQRFITAIVTPYNDPSVAAANYNKTYIVNQGANNATAAVQQKIIFGQPINGVYGANNTGVAAVGGMSYQGSSIVGSGYARALGIQQSTAAGSNCGYAPPEQFTNCVVKVSETAIEFNKNMGGIDLMCMDSTQLVLQYNVNRPECCLSAYLQPSYFAPSLTGQAQPSTSGALPVIQGAGTIAGNNQKFLNCCLIGDTTFQLTDVVLRIPYYTYNDDQSYSLVRQLTYQPQSYFSFRQQIDNIPGPGQMFSRLSIGGSSLIAGVWVFIVPQQASFPALSATGGPYNGGSPTPSASDCMVNYFGVNPPGVFDLRCNQAWDSYYVNMQDVYVQVNNKRYTVNAIPISNPELSTYLVTQSGIESAFGKYLNIPFHHYLANRFGFFIPINPFGDRSQIITDNQLIVSVTLDFTQRIANSQMYGESNLSPNNKFALLTVAQTMQSMVDCSYVKIA